MGLERMKGFNDLVMNLTNSELKKLLSIVERELRLSETAIKEGNEERK